MTGICPSLRVEISKKKIKKPAEGMKALKGHLGFLFCQILCFQIQVAFSEHLTLSL